MSRTINSRKKSRPANYWLHAVTGTFWQKLSTLQINSRWVWQTVCGEGCKLTAGGTIGAAAGGRINVRPIGGSEESEASWLAPTMMLKPRTKPPAFIVTSCGGECIDYNRSGDLFGAGESSTRGIFRTRFDWDKDANLPTDLYPQESRFGFQIHTLPFEARSTLLRLARTPCKVARLGKCNAAATKAHRTTAEYVETFRSEFDDVSARYSYLGASIQAGGVRASLQSAAKSHCP